MHDPNRAWKWAFVVALVAIALIVLIPPSETLKGGIDLVGGTSMLFEIDTTGLDAQEKKGLAGRVMDILKQRVDPGAQRNLEWRPIGNSRLEIRMPLPPREALERRRGFNEAMERIRRMNVWRGEIERALSAGEEQRDVLLSDLVRDVPEREGLFNALKTARDAYDAAQESKPATGLEEQAAAYEKAFSDVLATSMPETRLKDVLTIDKKEDRDAELAKLLEAFPSYNAPVETAEGEEPKGRIDQAVAAYDAWAKYKADLEDPSDLKRLLRGAGVLDFRILADRDASSHGKTRSEIPGLAEPIAKYTEQLAKYGPRPRAGDRYRWFEVNDVLDFMRLDDISQFEERKETSQQIVEKYVGKYYALVHADSEYAMTAKGREGTKKWKLKTAYPDRDPFTGRGIVTFHLDSRGGSLFGELTGANIGRQLCIMLDDVAMSHATIRDRITERCKIEGEFDQDHIAYLVSTLEAGALPARLKETPLMEKTIGPSLGFTNRTMGFRAAVVGGIVVVLFVLFYYGVVAGGMADIALALNLLFVLAVMAMMQATFTLPGIAALILTVGMAVDANVLIFERFREERDRGVVFKKALNAGYDKALSTIVDANLTTLITCVILGLMSTEEVKGFATVLGIGIVTSMFTALFVTRLVFNTLIAKGKLHDLSMRRLIHRPAIDWIGMRVKFWPISIVLVLCGIGLFVATSATDKEGLYDIEFLGGTNVQLDLQPGVELNEAQVSELITSTNRTAEEGVSAVQWLTAAADKLTGATVSQEEAVGQYGIRSPDLTAEQIISLMTDTLKDVLERGGATTEGRKAIFATKGEVTLEGFKQLVAQAAETATRAADSLRKARVQLVQSAAEATGGAGQEQFLSYDVATVATDRGMVQAALLGAMGENLQIQRATSFTTAMDEELTLDHYFVIEEDDAEIRNVLQTDATYDIRTFKGGVAIDVVLDATETPLTVEELETRLREVRVREEFSEFGSRDFRVLALGEPRDRTDGARGYSRFAVVSADPSLLYDDDPGQWEARVAGPELELVKAALGSEKSLSKVVQFAPQIAGQMKQNTVFAIVLALIAIVAYVWLRFGTMQYGLAAIVALVHDVCITLGAVTVSHFLYSTLVGKGLGMEDFKINLPMIAAILTVIGYSLNDTIVVFDRIRENRGKIGALSANLINNSINQTLSRTLLTSITTFLVVLVMYVAGGPGIKGFSYALLIGVVIGTYSSIGVATPLLYRPKVLNAVGALIAAIGLVGIVLAAVDPLYLKIRLVLCLIAVALCVYWAIKQNRKLGLTGGRVATA
jgi:SecD/SecF fusion protein